eukprot:CAMPEP_0114693360 /NCGR_PEP_ID=MMETSP0191-20121206/68981_1 /TAXON_ID=126664 /ORGANISM="Sorites sp." /LENGTH=312 /DNA_ID=CAMNT_0001986927 /DNA_START=22 /DNA_END=961 /DNA_ORIENTATION=+
MADEAGKDLAPEDLQLSEVDKTVSGEGFAYARLSCVGKQIGALGLLTEYPFIRHLDLSKNCIKDIQPISALRNVLSLNLSSNQISCTEWSPEDLPHLLYLDMAGNKLVELPQLHMPALRRADFRDNEIATCSKFPGHPTLQTLRLSGNQLTSAAGLHKMPKLEVLELSRNSLADLEGVSMLPMMSTKSLKAPWKEMASVAVLEAASNAFAEVKALEPLAETQLRSLTLTGCPLEEQDGVNVRLETLIFRPLQKLNGEEVTPEEQDEAKALNEKRLEEEAERLRQEEEARLAEEERLAEEARLAEAAKEGQEE